MWQKIVNLNETKGLMQETINDLQSTLTSREEELQRTNAHYRRRLDTVHDSILNLQQKVTTLQAQQVRHVHEVDDLQDKLEKADDKIKEQEMEALRQKSALSAEHLATATVQQQLDDAVLKGAVLRDEVNELKHQLQAPERNPSSRTCLACTTRAPVMAITCGHYPFCEPCTDRWNGTHCPLCRHPVNRSHPFIKLIHA